MHRAIFNQAGERSFQGPVPIRLLGVAVYPPACCKRFGRGTMNMTAIAELPVCVARPIVSNQGQRLPSTQDQGRAGVGARGRSWGPRAVARTSASRRRNGGRSSAARCRGAVSALGCGAGSGSRRASAFLTAPGPILPRSRFRPRGRRGCGDHWATTHCVRGDRDDGDSGRAYLGRRAGLDPGRGPRVPAVAQGVRGRADGGAAPSPGRDRRGGDARGGEGVRHPALLLARPSRLHRLDGGSRTRRSLSSPGRSRSPRASRPSRSRG